MGENGICRTSSNSAIPDQGFGLFVDGYFLYLSILSDSIFHVLRRLLLLNHFFFKIKLSTGNSLVTTRLVSLISFQPVL